MGDTYDQMPESMGGHGWTPRYNHRMAPQVEPGDQAGSGHFVSVMQRPHNCITPPAKSESYSIGTVWQCDTCKKSYRLTDDYRDGPFWDPIKVS